MKIGATLDSAALPDTGSFTTTLTQVEQAGTANPAKRDDLDLLDTRGMKGKGLFYPDTTMGDLAHGKSGVHLAAFTLENNSLENLDTLFVAFNNADMYFNSITRTEVRMVKAHLLLVDFINDIHSHDVCFTGYTRRMPPLHPGLYQYGYTFALSNFELIRNKLDNSVTLLILRSFFVTHHRIFNSMILHTYKPISSTKRLSCLNEAATFLSLNMAIELKTTFKLMTLSYTL